SLDSYQALDPPPRPGRNEGDSVWREFHSSGNLDGSGGGPPSLALHFRHLDCGILVRGLRELDATLGAALLLLLSLFGGLPRLHLPRARRTGTRGKHEGHQQPKRESAP